MPKTIIPDDGETIVFGSDGRDSSQDPNSHLAKILIIDPSNGDMEVTAVGVRNVQRLQYVWGGSAIAFADIGGVTAEEINVVNTADLVDTSVVENFGWGRNPDGNAREGTFYIGPGLTMVFGTEPPAIGNAPVPEPGFIQPHAQYSRANPSQFVGATGPAVSPASFDRFQAVFGDLNFGNVCATTDDLTTTDAIVVQPVLVDEDGVPLPNNTLNDLNDPPGRVDPRFFTFPDGTAGVLLEATGKFYRLTEIAD